MTGKTYKKSSRSGGSGGDCVEWAIENEMVWVRDSKDPDGPELSMTYDEWTTLLAAVQAEDQHRWIHHAADGTTMAKGDVTLRFTPAEWRAFTEGVRLGECALSAA